MKTTRQIPFFNYPALFREHEEEFVQIFRDVGNRGAYIMQRDLEEFEEKLRTFLGVKHAFGVADGTNALIIGLWASGIGPGDEVIVPSHTYIASPASVKLAGATPVLCDIGSDNMLDPASAEAQITDRTKGIMPVQVNGRTCNMDAIGELARKYGLQIFEDAAQGLGSRFKGQCAGTFGSFGTFSFYPAKVLGCFGDGGAVVTNDDDIAERVAMLRDHGRNSDGEVVIWGTNSRLDNLQAAVLAFKMQHYPDAIERRRAIARAYNEAFAQIPEIDPPVGPDDDADHFDVYQNYEMAADDRDALRQFLKDRGIGTIVQWAGYPIHQFRQLGFEQTPPKTEAFFQRCLMLPMNMAVSDEDVSYIIESVQAFYRQ